MLSSAERTLRWRPPVRCDKAAGSAKDGGEVLDVDSDDENWLDEDEGVCGYFVFGLSCPTAAMFLMRTMDRAAPQSMKAKVAPFHNFILERGGALKLCGERQKVRQRSDSHTSKPVTFKHREQCHNCYLLTVTFRQPSCWKKPTSFNFHSYRAFILPSVYLLWFCCQLIFTLKWFTMRELDITRWHLRIHCVFKVISRQPEGERK